MYIYEQMISITSGKTLNEKNRLLGQLFSLRDHEMKNVHLGFSERFVI